MWNLCVNETAIPVAHMSESFNMDCLEQDVSSPDVSHKCCTAGCFPLTAISFVCSNNAHVTRSGQCCHTHLKLPLLYCCSGLVSVLSQINPVQSFISYNLRLILILKYHPGCRLQNGLLQRRDSRRSQVRLAEALCRQFVCARRNKGGLVTNRT
jgi:hypothetical protein